MPPRPQSKSSHGPPPKKHKPLKQDGLFGLFGQKHRNPPHPRPQQKQDQVGPNPGPQNLGPNQKPELQQKDVQPQQPNFGPKDQSNFKPPQKLEKNFGPPQNIEQRPEINNGPTTRSEFKKPFEPSQPIAPTFNNKPADERKDSSPFSFNLAELLPKPSELKASPKSDEIPLKQSYSGDATKAVYVKAPPAPATVFINEPNPVYAVKEEAPKPTYTERAAPPPPPPPSYNQNARKDVVIEPAKEKKEDLKPTFGALKKEPFKETVEDREDTLVAPKVEDERPQEKQSYDAPAPSYGAPKPSYGPPPSKPSYAPPKPTYKPKPTYQPKPKPVYNPPPPPPTYAPAPPAPHIIYAGHPPIHIYQQPSVETLPAAPVYEPPTTPKAVYNPPPPAYNPPKQTYQDSAPAASYDAPQATYAKPEAPSYTPPAKEAPSYGPPKAPQKTAPKPPPSYTPPKKSEYTPPKPAKRPPPPKPSSYGPPAKPANYNPPPKSQPQPPAPAPPKQNYQANSAPVYIPAPKAFHKPPIIIYQGVNPPVHVYEQPAGADYAPPAQAKSSNVVELEEWNPSNGPQERSDSEPADSNVVATISVGSSLAGKSLDQQPETAKSLGSIEDVVKALAAEDEASEAIVSAKVSVESTDNKSRVTHKGTVEDLAVN